MKYVLTDNNGYEYKIELTEDQKRLWDWLVIECLYPNDCELTPVKYNNFIKI